MVNQRQRGDVRPSLLSDDHQVGQGGPAAARVDGHTHTGCPSLAQSGPAFRVEAQRLSGPGMVGTGLISEERAEDLPDGLLVTAQPQIHFVEAIDGPLGA